MTTAVEALKELLEDDTVLEIMVDGPNQIYVERRGKLEDTNIRFADEQELVAWANSLLALHGWEPVGEKLPWVEGRLRDRDGGRILVVVPPVAVKGPSVIVRKALRGNLTFDQVLELGSLNQTILDFLKIVMQARLNVIISGGTASGKTTLTNMVVELVPEEERVIAVEWANELRLRNKRVIYLEAQAASPSTWSKMNASGDSEVKVSELLRVAARMRPDRVIVGELMGGETLEMLRLMNTGHEGMVATIHAKSPRDTLARLEKMATMAEPSLTLPVIRAEITAAIDLIIQANRLEDGSRKIVSIVEVQDLKGDNIVLQELFAWKKTGVGEDGRFTGIFEATGATPSFEPALEAKGLTFPEGMFKA
jgi:pilus assembly protein CpaF